MTVASAKRGRPLPAGTAARLPAGAFYLLAGPDLSSLNVWEVGPGPTETQITHNRAGHGIDALAASESGIVVADAAHGTDRLARWTRHGLSWLRHGHRGPLIVGSSPDIRGNGTIGYVTPPSASGAHRNADFAIWTQPSFSSRATVIYRQRRPLDGPVFGPHGQIAIEGWSGPEGGRRPTVLIYAGGQVAMVSTGVSEIPSLLAWGHRAPALAVAFPGHRAELLYTGRPPAAAAVRLAAAGLEPVRYPAADAVRHGAGDLVGYRARPGTHGRRDHPRDVDPPGRLAVRQSADVTPGSAGAGRNSRRGGFPAM